MKCDECIHNDVCSMQRVSNTDVCNEFLSVNCYGELEDKLESLLSYITDGQYSKSSYSIEEMQTFVDDAIQAEIDKSVELCDLAIEEYKNDISNLREENIALKDIIVKMVMERMRRK